MSNKTHQKMAKKQTINLPDNLQDETKEWLATVLVHLKKNDKFNVIDSGALQMLATAFDTYILARNDINANGLTYTSDRGNIQPNPAFQMMKQSMAQAMEITKEFGLTLKSRSRLSIIDADGEESPLVTFLKK